MIKIFLKTPDFPAGAFLFDLGNYFQRLTQLKEEYQKKLEVRIGVEIGLQPHLGEYYRELTEKYPFDFVIGSVHLIHGQDPYYRTFFEGRSDEEAYQEAFQVTIENLKKVNLLTAWDIWTTLSVMERIRRRNIPIKSMRKRSTKFWKF